MKTYKLELASATVIEGKIIRRGAEVTVDEAVAKNLLARGKAKLVSAPDDDGDEGSEGVDLSRLNKAQLIDAAQALGIEGATEMSKAQLVAAIQAADKANP